ncbi:hypothetical protein AKO1_014518 [Acrasis kona]|uniref:STB5 n=1 Tax=Acrasis kona TaxID=1008807 RepID=A0AAW2Z2A4_9EUKA
MKDTTSAELAAFACLNCKKGHRRCDRELPTCSTCNSKGRNCVYENPASSKRMTPYEMKQIVFTDVTPTYTQNRTSTSAVPLVNPTSVRDTKENKAEVVKKPLFSPMNTLIVTPARESELIRSYLACQHNELVYEDTCTMLPLVSPTKIKDVMHYVHEVMCAGREETNAFRPLDEEIALVMSIGANSFSRSNNKPIASYLFDKARNLLQAYHESVETNYLVASCHSLFSTYLVSIGELERAKYYIRNSRTFLDGPASSTIGEQYLGFLRLTLLGSELLLQPNSNSTQMFRYLIMVYDMYQLLSDTQQNRVHQHKSRMNDVLDPSVIDSVLCDYFLLLDHFPTPLSPTDCKVKKLIYLMSAQAAKIQFLSEQGMSLDHHTLALANSITDLIDADMFKYCNQLTSINIVEAATVQMRFLLNCHSADLMEKLRKDLYGLRALAERFHLVLVRFGSFIEGLERLISMHETHPQFEGNTDLLTMFAPNL